MMMFLDFDSEHFVDILGYLLYLTQNSTASRNYLDFRNPHCCCYQAGNLEIAFPSRQYCAACDSASLATLVVLVVVVIVAAVVSNPVD